MGCKGSRVRIPPRRPIHTTDYSYKNCSPFFFLSSCSSAGAYGVPTARSLHSTAWATCRADFMIDKNVAPIQRNFGAVTAAVPEPLRINKSPHRKRRVEILRLPCSSSAVLAQSGNRHIAADQDSLSNRSGHPNLPFAVAIRSAANHHLSAMSARETRER